MSAGTAKNTGSRAFVLTGLIGLGALVWSGLANADTTHTVARGHTLESIANRYHVSPKAIVDANKLKHPDKLKPGDVLIIPGVKDTKSSGAGAKDGKDSAKGAKVGEPKPDPKKTKPVTYTMRPKSPGLLHLTRLATSEEANVRVVDHHGKASPAAMKQMEKLLRSAGGQSKPINPRLLALVTIVSDHFGGRKIEVISGFRPYSPSQHTAHSNHNIGSAMDFRVVGVPNEVVRDYCKTLHNVGVGYYPNSTFVHLDTRASSAYWIDYSRPGETPRYSDANSDPDEGTSDVGADVLMPPPVSPNDAPSSSSGDDSDDDSDSPGTSLPSTAAPKIEPAPAAPKTAPELKAAPAPVSSAPPAKPATK